MDNFKIHIGKFTLYGLHVPWTEHYGLFYFSVNRSSLHSLVNRGANGGAAGNDVRAIEKHPDKTCDIKGAYNHEVPSMPIVTTGGVTSTISGEFVLIMHQYAYHPKCATIHSSAQIECYKNMVDDRSMKVGGRQHITTFI